MPWLDTILAAVCAGLLVLPQMIKGTSQSSQVDISGLVGSTVRLPCHVDTKTCGNLHSIKWYRGSSRIFVFSDMAKFWKSEGDYESRANLVYSDRDTTSYLEVRGIKINDEAVYKCEITYLDVVESCLVVQFINLTTLIAPSRLVITSDQSPDKITEPRKIGPFNEDSSLSLTCEVDRGKPIPTLQWFKNNQEIGGEYLPDSISSMMGAAVNKKRIKLSRNDLGAVYECRASSQALNKSLSLRVEILVNVKPSKMELTGFDGSVDQNSTVTLTCAVYEARPPAHLTWYNGSRKLDEKDNNITKENFPKPDGTVNTVSRLTFIATRFENMKIFRCIAHNEVMRDQDLQMFEKTTTIKVYFAPIITILPEQITVNETADVYLNCSYEANPLLIQSTSWYFNGTLMTRNKTTHEFREYSLLLKKVNRNFLGKYFCSLQNSVGSSNSTEAELNVLYPPTVHILADPIITVNESASANVTLICKVLRGNPTNLTNVRWYFNGQYMYEFPNVSVLYLEMLNRGHHGNYSCSGQNGAGWGPLSFSVQVVVQYQPGPASLSYEVEFPNGTKYNKDKVLKGSTVFLICNLEFLGRPEVTKYHWYAGSQELLKDSQNNTLPLTNVGAKEKLTNYSCNAENAAGFGENASISINVVAPPSFIHAERYIAVTKDNKTADLKCLIECDPACDVWWKKNYNETIVPNEVYEIDNKNVPADAAKNDFESVVSTLRINLFNLEGGHVEPKRDDAIYTCESSGNSFGPGVRNNIDFQVHFAPTKVSVRTQVIDVTDKNIPSRVTCSAYGRPDPAFRWYNGSANETFSSDATLSFSTALSRNASTNFTCEASNRVGSATTSVFFNILYKPTCSIEQFRNEGKVLLICKAVGNPPPKSYNWTSDDSEIADARMDDRGSNLEIEPPAATKIYNCTATNEINTSDVCFAVVEASDDWWLWRMIKSSELPVLVLVIIAVAVILIVIIICVLIIFICRKKRAKEKYNNRIDLPNRQNFDNNNGVDGAPPAPILPKWPLKPGVLVHVNNNHSLSARRLQNASNLNVSPANGCVGPQSPNQFYSVSEKRFKREQLKFKTDNALPGVFHGKSGVVSFKKYDNPVLATNPRKRKKPGTGPSDLGGKNKNNYHSPNDALLQPESDKAFYENLPFHGMQNPPNKLDCDTPNTRPPSVQSQCDGSSGYGSTRSQVANVAGAEKRLTAPGAEQSAADAKFNSFRPHRARRNWPQFRSLRSSKKAKIPMLPIKEGSSPDSAKSSAAAAEPTPKTHPKPVPAPRKVIGFSFNKPSAKHTYQNVPIPITPNKICVTSSMAAAAATVAASSVTSATAKTVASVNSAAANADPPKKVGSAAANSSQVIRNVDASKHLTNSSPMEYFRLTPTTNCTRPYNGNISASSNSVSLKKYKLASSSAAVASSYNPAAGGGGGGGGYYSTKTSSTLSRVIYPDVSGRHETATTCYPSTHHLNNGLVYADLTVSRHKKKHQHHPRPSPISHTQTYPYHTEYAVIKFHDVGREIDV